MASTKNTTQKGNEVEKSGGKWTLEGQTAEGSDQRMCSEEAWDIYEGSV